jgi:hypothetical protein
MFHCHCQILVPFVENYLILLGELGSYRKRLKHLDRAKDKLKGKMLNTPAAFPLCFDA